MAESERKLEYEVMNPWAYSDPVPQRGITARLDGLEGKKIGLFCNGKRAGELTLNAVERELKALAPTLTTSWYVSTELNVPEALTKAKEKFAAWVGSMDAVVLSVAD